jgi:hypothetical protein
LNADADPDPATQINADPCGSGSGYGSGSETLVGSILPPAPCVVGGVLIIRDLGRHVELGIVDGGLVERGGAHTVPRHIARQAQCACCAKHGAAASPPAPAIRAQILSLGKQCCGSGMFILDTGSDCFPSWIRIFPSRITDPHQGI